MVPSSGKIIGSLKYHQSHFLQLSKPPKIKIQWCKSWQERINLLCDREVFTRKPPWHARAGMLPDYLRQSKIHVGGKKQSWVQPRFQGLSSYRPQERTRRDGLSSLAPGGGKMRDPGNEVVFSQVIGTFRLDYEYAIEYEYDFRISNQWRFQSPRSSCWFKVENVVHGMKWVCTVIMWSLKTRIEK